MFKQMRIVRAAGLLAAAVLSFTVQSAMARADQASEPFSLSSDSPKYLDENLPSVAPGAPLNPGPAPLMALLSSAGVGQALDQIRINIYGYAEGSYTFNFYNPARGYNLGREFDINDNRFQMNQADLKFERKADPHQFDVGFMFEMNYGTDDRFIHSSDFLGDSASTGNNSSSSNSNPINNGPEYQFDIPQLYVDITAPLGNGLRIRLGKFLFFKQIDPNASVFYSHSFTFGAALPFTLTGVTAYYPITDEISVEGGIARGWGQTFTDNNGAIDALGRVRYKIDKQTDFSVAMVIGPELNHDNSHYRTVLDGTLTYAASNNLTLLFDGVYGYQAQPEGTETDQWYGLSGYAVYKLCSYANLNSRLEVYRDAGGFTTGVSQTLFEGTLGLTITPFPDSTIGSNLKIRPEVRYDYSTRAYFNGFMDHGQCTVAMDAYFDF